jgi:hypothetical protein
VSQELSVALVSRVVPVRTPVEALDRPAKRGDLNAPRGPAAISVAPVARADAGEIIDVSWSTPAAKDPEEIIATLRAERTVSRGGFNHPHAGAGCAFCRRAVAAYR